MSIIYSYPEQTPLSPNDMLIGTSTVKVGGKQKNITRNFSVQQIADFIGEGGTVFDPTASDFQIGVFNQGGTKLTGSIMSQDAFPGGTGITVAGNLTTTNNLTALGDVVLGNQQLTNNIKLLSETYLSGQIRDIGGNLGGTDQILISNNIGFVSWTDYKAGLVYQGVWDATTGRTTPGNILLESGVGQNGQFYIVTVAGNYQLDGNPASPESPPYWQVGDWVVFVSKGSTNEWQKIDNTSVLTGTGTDNKIAMWTGGATPSVTLTDSLISQDAGATTVTVAGSLTSTSNISGVNITGAGDLSGVNLLLTGTVSLNAQLGNPGQVLTSQGTADAIWANPTPVNNITGSGTANTLSMFTGQYTVGDSAVTQSADALTVDVLTKTVTDASAYTINTNIGKLTRQGMFPGAGALTSNVTIGAQYTYGNVDMYGSNIELHTYNAPSFNSSPITLWSSSTSGLGVQIRTDGGSIVNVAGTYSIQATGAGAGSSPEAVQIQSNTGVKFEGQGNAANINFRSYNTNLNDSGDINFISETEEGQAGNVSFSSIATDANGTAGEIRLAGAGISTSATDAVPLGLVIASNGHVKTGSVGDTYTLGSSTDGSNVKLNLDAANGTDSAVTLTGAGGLTIAQTNDIVTLTAPAGSDTTYALAAGVKSANSVPLNLTPSTGSGTAVNLTEGTGITLTQTSATEITIAGVAQGVTGSGTVNKLPKFGTTTSLTDSLVSEVPASSSSSYTATNSFFVGASQFAVMAGIRRLRWLRSQDINAFPTLTFPPNTATGTGVLVLTGDIILDADGTDVITAGTYNVDVSTGVSGGVWNSIELFFSAADWLQPAGVTGNVSYANSGAVTSFALTTAATLAEIEIAAKLDMTTHKIINVVDPTDAQDAATKQYVDNSVVGGLIYQGGYDASTNTPVLDSRGTQIAVSKGWTYTVTADGTFYTETVKIGDVLIAEVDIAAGAGALTDWTTVQSNIDVASATVQGIANFPTGNDGLNISSGAVTAKLFSGSTPGYVPDATSATAGTFLKEDGTWSAIAPTTGVGSYTTGNGTILSPQTTSVQLAISAISASGSVFTFLNGLNLGDLVQITDGTVNGFFTYTAAGGGPNGYRFAYVSGEIPTNFSTASNVINLRNANAGVVGDISGSGNGSSVTYFTGVVGDTGVKEITSNPNIVIDATGNFGIGTDTPQSPLHIYKSNNGGVGGELRLDNNNGAIGNKTRILFSDGGGASSVNDRAAIVCETEAVPYMGQLQFQTGVGSISTKMLITGTGKVGIGTTSPDDKLEVSGTGQVTSRIISTDNNGARFDLHSSGGGRYSQQALANGDFFMYDETNSHNVQRYFDGASGAWAWYTAGSERMRIDSSGNVGIGTTSPAAKLHIQGTSSVGIKSVYATAIIESGDAQLDITSGPGGSWGSSLNFVEGNGAVNTDVWSIARTTSSNNSDLTFNFGTNNQHSNDTKVLFNSNGNVGIGTTTPSVSLDLGSKTDAVQLPAGDNTARAAISNPFGGMIRYNTTDDQFEGYSGVGAAGSWGAIGGGGASATITSNQTTTINATTTVFALGATPNGSSVNFVDAFIDGVYQETTTYSVSGQNLTFNDPVPSGVTVETKTIADYNVGAVVTTASLGQTNTTGNVNLRIIPNYIISNITAQANNLYIFDSTTQAYTLTLPSSPQPGDSIKISIRGGLATNVLAVPATENIMGGVLGVPLTINNATAAFEIIYSGDSTKQGWVIIGNV